MQSNQSAGIITYRETKVPQIFSALAQPKLTESIIVSDGMQDINIYLFDCPVNGDKVDKKGYRLLRNLVDTNKVKFLVERFETKVESNVSPRKDEIHYSKLLQEIQAIKLLAVLIKISQERQECILAENIGFIVNNVDSLLIDLLSEEASNVYYYEGSDFTEHQKMKLHNHFMEKKGVSIVFSKSIADVIANSTILVIDKMADLNEYKMLLDNKIVIGESKDHKIKAINSVVLWNNASKINKVDSVEFQYNNEILAIIRYYNMNLDIIDFIKRLPYIYYDY
jgi:hypothetical protein